MHTQGERSSQTAKHLRSPRKMHQTQQELMKRQGNKLEKSYIELTPGTPVWVQHRKNATWEPAIVVNQCAPNSYWILQENGTEQSKAYRQTRSMLKIRSTPTEVEQTGYMNSHPSYSQYSQRLCQGEFSGEHFTRPCAIDIAQIRHSSLSSF